MNREIRYTVLKDKDVRAALTGCEARILDEICRKVNGYRLDNGRGPLCAVVVEHDWPEYEPTWSAIEERIDAEAAENRKKAGL